MELALKSKSKLYGWKETSSAFVLDLGKIKRAVVIHRSYINQDYYRIGVGSFFPFTDEIYSTKYSSLEEAKKVASEYILDWLSETNLALKIM